MLPLYPDPWFTFQFADDRLGLLATATVAEGGWVDWSEPILVRAGEAFVTVLDPE